MSVLGLRKKIKGGIKKALGVESAPSDTTAPNWQNRSPDYMRSPEQTAAAVTPEPTPVEKVQAAPEPSSTDDAAKAEPLEAEPLEAEPLEAEAVVADAVPAEEVPAEATAEAEGSNVEAAAEEVTPEAAAESVSTLDDTAGPPFTMEEVQEILDDMVRPALQGDGGDISLLRIEENNVYVKLVGACTTCPSSVLTMKMGVEALLKEEFPGMNELISE